MDEPVTPDARGRVGAYFGLVFLGSVPFWLLSQGQILPGLPLAALMVICPAAAALGVTVREGGWPAAGRLLAGLVRFSGGRRTLFILALPFLVAALVFLILRSEGADIPNPQVSLPGLALLLLLFLPGAAAEELGWTGYAMGPLTARFGTLGGGLILGAAWAAWHYPALILADRDLGWIAWWTLGTVAMRVIIVQACRHVGLGLMGAVLFHTASNLAWQLFPVNGSWFDPQLHGLLMAASAAALSVAWRPR